MDAEVTHALGIAGASFVFIMARAFQQLNVQHHRIPWVFPTSAIMAVTEVAIISGVVIQGFWAWVPMAIGGSTGCVAAMLLHKRMRG